jgi:hypothetical protein
LTAGISHRPHVHWGPSPLWDFVPEGTVHVLVNDDANREVGLWLSLPPSHTSLSLCPTGSEPLVPPQEEQRHHHMTRCSSWGLLPTPHCPRGTG